MKKVISLILSLVMILCTTLGLDLTAYADQIVNIGGDYDPDIMAMLTCGATDPQTYNVDSATRIKSYVYKDGKNFVCVYYTDGKIFAEYYSSSFKFISKRSINMELSIWGGFYSGDNYNYFVFGQSNYNEDDEKRSYKSG